MHIIFSRPQLLRLMQKCRPTCPSHVVLTKHKTVGKYFTACPKCLSILILLVLSQLFGLGWLSIWEIKILYARNIVYKGPLLITWCDVLLKYSSGCELYWTAFEKALFQAIFLCLHVSLLLTPRALMAWAASTSDHSLECTCPLCKCILAQSPPEATKHCKKTKWNRSFLGEILHFLLKGQTEAIPHWIQCASTDCACH